MDNKSLKDCRLCSEEIIQRESNNNSTIGKCYSNVSRHNAKVWAVSPDALKVT